MRLFSRLFGKPQLEERHGFLETVNAEILKQGGLLVPESLPAVFRATQMLSDMVAQLPLVAVDRVTGLELADQPAILKRPDPSKTRHDFLSELMSSLLYRGNAYLYSPAVDRTGNSLAFMVIPPDDVTVTENAERTGIVYEWTAKNIALVPGRNLVHIRLGSRPGQVVGLSPITAARLSLEGFEALERYSRDYFNDNANPSGVLSTPGTLEKKEADRLKAQWNESHRSKRDVAILSGGLEFKPLMFSPEDSQFLQTREFEVGDVARLFGIPAPLLGASAGDSLTYATTESVVRWLLVTTLNPTYLERIEQALSIMLPRTWKANFDTQTLLRADTQARFTAHETAINAGFMTPNEVRKIERLGPKEGGDDLARSPQNSIRGFAEPAESGGAADRGAAASL